MASFFKSPVRTQLQAGEARLRPSKVGASQGQP